MPPICLSQCAFAGSTRCAGVTFGLPKIHQIPICISVIPMTVMTVPVTTDGKKRSRRLATGAISIPNTPAAMIDPKMILAPSAPGCGMAMATIGPTEAKVTPIITGRRTPNQRVSPKDWIIETIPQAKRSAEIRKATSGRDSLRTPPMI